MRNIERWGWRTNRGAGITDPENPSLTNHHGKKGGSGGYRWDSEREMEEDGVKR